MNYEVRHVNKLIETCTHLDRVDSRNEKLFIDGYLSKNKPCVLTGLADDWQTDKWTLDFFKENYGDIKFEIGRMDYTTSEYEKKDIIMRDYIDYVKKNKKGNEAVPFYGNLDFYPPKDLLVDYNVPEYFKCGFDNFRDIEEWPTLSWIYIAPANSITDLHIDIGNSNAWNLLISGTKLWVFYLKDQLASFPEGTLNPFNPKVNKSNLLEGLKPLVCVQKPGEVVFTPSGAIHSVLNLETGICLTENFINQFNFEEVKKFCLEHGVEIPDLSIH